MRTIHKALVGAALAAAFLGAAWAQTVVTQALTGNENVRFSLPVGGTGGVTTVNALRNATSLSTIGAATTVNASSVASTGLLIATGAVTTLNATLPPSPFNGQRWGVACPGGTITTLTISVNSTPSGQTITGVNPTTCSATLSPTAATFTYGALSNTWFRTQ